MSKPQWLLNPKSGAVMACTDLLLRLGKGLVACSEDGTPLETYNLNEDDDVMESNFLLNPKSGAIMQWTLLLARKEGLIPCNDRDHANRILLNLGADELVKEPATVTAINAKKVDPSQEIEPENPVTGETVGLDPDSAEGPGTEDVVLAEEEVKVEDGTPLEELAEIAIPEAIDKMTNKKAIVKFVKDKFGEQLDARVNITMLKEQAAMLMNGAEQDETRLDEVSMV